MESVTFTAGVSNDRVPLTILSRASASMSSPKKLAATAWAMSLKSIPGMSSKKALGMGLILSGM